MRDCPKKAYKAFQFTPLREGRHACAAPSPAQSRYFNSRPSARGDDDPDDLTDNPYCISIHAPPRGATCPETTLFRRLIHFNSRPSARGDATSTACRTRRQNFNSRPSARGDPAVSRVVSLPFVFQFTPLREGRHAISAARPAISIFQFTPLREGRQMAFYLCRCNPISIHAPPRGATFERAADGQRETISIHAPPRGATGINKPDARVQRFQFTPLREGRHRRYAQVDGHRGYFNSRPSARGDDAQAANEPRPHQISIHAPPRGATRQAGYPTACRRFQFTPLREGRHARR